MDANLLNYYEAIERASTDMLKAARDGNWDEVARIEGACMLLISQLKSAAEGRLLSKNDAKAKSKMMQRILLNDAELRHLAEPWLEELDGMYSGRNSRQLH